VTNVSLVDLTVTLSRPVANKDELFAPFRLAAQRSPSQSTSETAASAVPCLSGVMAVSDEKLVSSDYLSALQSSIIDVDASVMLNERTAKIVAWYDNEVGFASRSEYLPAGCDWCS
jgi:glyceraldehyde 3-phosphate dehydrogenase